MEGRKAWKPEGGPGKQKGARGSTGMMMVRRQLSMLIMLKAQGESSCPSSLCLLPSSFLIQKEVHFLLPSFCCMLAAIEVSTIYLRHSHRETSLPIPVALPQSASPSALSLPLSSPISQPRNLNKERWRDCHYAFAHMHAFVPYQWDGDTPTCEGRRKEDWEEEERIGAWILPCHWH